MLHVIIAGPLLYVLYHMSQSQSKIPPGANLKPARLPIWLLSCHVQACKTGLVILVGICEEESDSYSSVRP